MGVCNITKDSFSDGGLNYRKKDALKSIKLMLKNGASIIDIGAESARPGSDPISYKEEIKRLDPILKVLPKNKFIISIDTYKTETQELGYMKPFFLGMYIIEKPFEMSYMDLVNK